MVNYANETTSLRLWLFRLASLLSKFRIAYSDLIIIPDVMQKASAASKGFFDDLVKDYTKANDGKDPGEKLLILRGRTLSFSSWNEHFLTQGIHVFPFFFLTFRNANCWSRAKGTTAKKNR